MKRSVLSFGFSALMAAASASAVELLQNGGFESGTQSWEFAASGGVMSAGWAARNGTNGVVLGNWWAGAWGWFRQTITGVSTANGSVLVFSADGLCGSEFRSSTRDVYLKIELLQGTNVVQTVTNNIYAAFTNSSGWGRWSVGYTNNGLNINGVRVEIGFGGGTGVGGDYRGALWDNASLIQSTPTAVTRTNVFVLLGQSNMSGWNSFYSYAYAPPSANVPHPRVLQLSRRDPATQTNNPFVGRVWRDAVDPLTHHDFRRNCTITNESDPKYVYNWMGVGPGKTFAETLAEAWPDTKILLVPNAHGGTAIRWWQKTNSETLFYMDDLEGGNANGWGNDYGTNLYNSTLDRIRYATNFGTLAGIIWHQGEGDSGSPDAAAAYSNHLNQLINDLRTDLSRPGLPFVVGELGQFFIHAGESYSAYATTVVAALEALPTYKPATAFVHSDGLDGQSDKHHFTGNAQREFGVRYAREMYRVIEPLDVYDDGEILSRHESGEQLYVFLQGDAFAPSLNAAQWSYAGLPAGISIGSVSRLSATAAVITLSGNATNNYEDDIIHARLTVQGSQFTSGAARVCALGPVFRKTHVRDGSFDKAPSPWRTTGSCVIAPWAGPSASGGMVMPTWTAGSHGTFYQDALITPLDGTVYTFRILGRLGNMRSTTSNIWMRIEVLTGNSTNASNVRNIYTNMLANPTAWLYHEIGVTSTAPNATTLRVSMGYSDSSGSNQAEFDEAESFQSGNPPAPPPPPDETNLLNNGGFRYGSDGTTNADAAAQFWATWGETSRENWGSKDSDGWLASIHGWSGTNYGGWVQTVGATAGLHYVFSGYFSADANYTYSSLEMKCEFLDASSNLISATTSRISGVGTDWAYYEAEGRAPSNAAWIKAVVLATGQGTSGAFKLDALSLKSYLPTELAKLEPEHGVLTGVNLDWSSDTTVQFNQKITWDHVCFVDFTEFPRAGGYGALDSHIDQVRNVGGYFVITLEPHAGLSVITSNDCATFAGWCAYWNAQGVPILVRFAHEMNGDWYAWKMRPALYREKFRLLANAVHSIATNTAMLWAPNEAGGYPYGVYQNMTRAAYTNGYGTLADWYLLDSNGDGILSNGTVLNDDPYEPFYPGDTYVDWVGMTIYHWGTAYPWWYNCAPEPQKLSDLITGNYNGPNGDHRWNPDFYAVWSQGRNKPMMIGETAAYYRPGAPTPPDPYWPPRQNTNELTIKRLWLDQVYRVTGDDTNALDIAAHFPRLKGINWFNWRKIEAEAQNDWVDWTVTSNAAVMAEYYNRLNTTKNGRRWFLHVSDLKGLVYGWNCSLDGWGNSQSPFTVSLETNYPYEGRGCVKIAYNDSSSPYGKTVMADFSALQDALVGWSNACAIYLRARVPASVAWASFRLIMQSAENGWDVLTTTSAPPDNAWHTLVFPYQWTNHDSSAWLNLYLQVDLPTGNGATVYVDAVEAVMDVNANGIPYGQEEDDDSDGMPDAWETANGLNPHSSADAAEDSDGDRFSNYAEWVAGTDPMNPASLLELDLLAIPAARNITFWANSNRLYSAQFTENLLHGSAWSNLVSDVAGTNGWMVISDTNSAAFRAYRVKARLP
jgi:hypothetical protein